MNTNKIKEKVQELIIEGKLENAAETIIDFLDSGVMNKKDKALFQLYNQSIHQISQLNELKNAQRSGIIDSDDADLKRNQIRFALLEINNQIANWGSEEEKVFEPITPDNGTKNTGDGGTQTNKVLYAIIGLLAAGIIGLSAMFFLKKDDEPIKEVKTEITQKEERTTPKVTKDISNETKKNQQEEAKRIAAEEARKKKLADVATSKTTITKIDPKILKPVQIDPNIAQQLLDDFSRLTPNKIKSFSSKMRMSAISSDKLKKGSILVYKTGTRRFGKLEILEIDSNLKIRATTYSSSGAVRKSTPSVVIQKNKACDLDLGIMTRSGIDFQWEEFSDGRRQIQPRDQAVFYQIK